MRTASGVETPGRETSLMSLCHQGAEAVQTVLPGLPPPSLLETSESQRAMDELSNFLWS